jgi:hypothetical protein
LREQYYDDALERFKQAHRLVTFAYAKLRAPPVTDDRPFASPRYWAAFIASGNALGEFS